jgi:hypothetical protein
MKNIALIFLITIAFANCKSVVSQQEPNSNPKTETNLTKIETTPISVNLLKDLTKKQKQKLDESISPKDREILDKAGEIDIYYNIDKETKGLRTLTTYSVPNAGARLSDTTLKKQFLENFYYDVAVNEGGALCFSPRHKIVAKYKNKIIDLDICYQCGNFEGSGSNGNIGGSINRDGKSGVILSETIEKYGTDIK